VIYQFCVMPVRQRNLTLVTLVKAILSWRRMGVGGLLLDIFALDK
jgi:hypothetical protein